MALHTTLPCTMHAPLFRIAARLTGAMLIIAAVLGLLGWLQGGDPDCLLHTEVLLQARLCGPEWVDEPDAPPLAHLMLILGLLLLGACCLRLGLRRDGGPEIEPPPAPRS